MHYIWHKEIGSVFILENILEAWDEIARKQILLLDDTRDMESNFTYLRVVWMCSFLKKIVGLYLFYPVGGIENWFLLPRRITAHIHIKDRWNGECKGLPRFRRIVGYDRCSQTFPISHSPVSYLVKECQLV